jgi:hypothetical protein
VTAPYVPPRRTWRGRLREVATERLGLKAIALLLAVLLWLVVHARRPAEDDMAARVTPLLDAPRRAPGVRAEPTVVPAAPADSTVATSP